MASFHGIVVYEIIDNGNVLNGIYTNDVRKRKPDRVDNEIATKIEGNTYIGIEGIWHVRYIENVSPTVVTDQLHIKKLGSVYEFNWGTSWVGIGLMAGKNHIAAAYTNA